VIPTIAIRGQGVRTLPFSLGDGQKRNKGKIHYLSLDVERIVSELADLLGVATATRLGVPQRFLAIRLLEEDEESSKLCEKSTLAS